VEENNLRVHIAAIRKLLADGQRGARFIINVAGRGYSFVAPVTRVVDVLASSALLDTAAHSSLPVALTRVLGRKTAISSVVELVGQHRLVTVVGPGGIGKTTLALAVADYLPKTVPPQNLCFVDLAGAPDEVVVPSVLLSAVGISGPTDDPISALGLRLQAGRTLLILDNCEHVVGVIAAIVERILQVAPGVRILATSRERLLAQGEQVFLLDPLPYPAAATHVTAAQALEYSAVQLFAERASAASDQFEITDRSADAIAAVCRRLDGVPLAIELVAARVNALGLEVLANSIEDSALLLLKGRRTSGARHQSLSAALAWSYRLLSTTEQVVLRQLSVFSKTFSLESAAGVVSGAGVDAAGIAETLLSLAAKSLVMTDTSGPAVRYRLLHVTRAFTAECLSERGELRSTQYRHASYHLDVLETASSDWELLSRREWTQRYGSVREEVQAALHWAFGPDGDIELGAHLIVVSLPLGFQLSSHEFQRRASLALGVLERRGPSTRIAELRVRTALTAIKFQAGAQEEEIDREVEQMVELALEIDIPKHMIEALTAQAIRALERVDYVAGVVRFELLQSVARRADDPIAALVVDRLGAQVFHWAGDHRKARVRAERALRHPSTSIPLVYEMGIVEKNVSTRIILARIRWLEGRANEAQRIVCDAMEVAETDSPTSVCQLLAFASCPLAFWCGDYVLARELTERLATIARLHMFERWHRLAMCYQKSLALLTRSADTTTNDMLIQAGPIGALQRDLLGTISEYWVDSEIIGRAERGLCGWCTSELLRVGGRLIQGEVSAGAAETRFRAALQIARAQGALAFELRSALSLSRLLLHQDRRTEGRSELSAVFDQFHEGYETADLRAAKTLLTELS
jgi:predicted ATPase